MPSPPFLSGEVPKNLRGCGWFYLDLFPDSLHCGKDVCAAVVLVCGGVTCHTERQGGRYHQLRCVWFEGHLPITSLVWLPTRPPVSPHLASLIRSRHWVGREGFSVLVLGVLLFAHCCLFPVGSLPPSGLWASDPPASCPWCHRQGGCFVSIWGFLAWIGSIEPAGLMDGLIDNRVDPCSAGWHAPYFTGRRLMRIKEVVRSSEQPIKTIKREEWKMRF